MRITSILAAVAVTAQLAALPAGAQESGPHGEHDGGLTPAPEALTPRTRQLGHSMQRLREEISQTNRWMIVHGSAEGLHGVGTELAHSAEHLQELIRRLDQAYTESEVDGAPATRQQVDAVAAEVRALEAEMSRTLGALRRAVGYR